MCERGGGCLKLEVLVGTRAIVDIASLVLLLVVFTFQARYTRTTCSHTRAQEWGK